MKFDRIILSSKEQSNLGLHVFSYIYVPILVLFTVSEARKVIEVLITFPFKHLRYRLFILKRLNCHVYVISDFFHDLGNTIL